MAGKANEHPRCSSIRKIVVSVLDAPLRTRSFLYDSLYPPAHKTQSQIVIFRQMAATESPEQSKLEKIITPVAVPIMRTNKCPLWVISGICGTTNVRFTSDSDRESGFPQTVMSALHPKADACGALAHVGLGPIANIGRYSITSSARSSSDRGIVSPSAFAVLLFMTNSNRVAWRSGKSLGRVPPRIFATCSAAFV